ncbi:MAG TPA: hypothetical protein VFH38_07045 [Jatrophihabitans sp.]|nr:hypothetical protein [Jatrophihabitans sp.]
MATSGFRVDPQKLLEVADEVHELLRLVNGDAGYVAGSLRRYQERADASVLTQALSSFWNGEDVFATAYSNEHGGVVTTMSSMVAQLSALESACRSTAQQYQGQDERSTRAVRQSGPEGTESPVVWK